VRISSYYICAISRITNNTLHRYVVESIIKHKWFAPEGKYKYLVKWQGYDDPKDQTWEPSENLQDILAYAEYLEAIGGEPEPPATGPKKRGPKPSIKRPRDFEGTDAPRRGRPAKKGKVSEDEGDSGVESVAVTKTHTKTRYPPTNSKWDDKIAEIFTIEEKLAKETPGYERFAVVVWEDGVTKTRHRLKLMHANAPQSVRASLCLFGYLILTYHSLDAELL
jgi:chromobox protein 1